jgi:RNA polymerase sigma-70 factor (ECF subfamily)
MHKEACSVATLMSADYGKHTDNELFRLFKESEMEKDTAFRELYSRYEHRVYVFCLRMTGNPEDAADIFQETFTRFYRNTKQGDTVSNMLAYLLTIARNAFLNSRRNRVPWSPFEDETVAGHVPLYERTELLNIVGSALELLEPVYREAFVLRFYQGLSYKEISEITGDSVSALKVRVMRAKDRVKEILSPYISDLVK